MSRSNDSSASRQGFLKTPPFMSDDMSYQEWKSEVELWCEITDVPANKQGGSLFFTLQGDARDTVRAKVDKKRIASDEGVKDILAVLDNLYAKDEHQAGFTAYEEFVSFRRPHTMSIKDYVIQFNLKNSKLKTYKMDLPEGVLAYNLLIGANLSKEQQELCRATVADMTYLEMKKTIEKVAVPCSSQRPNQDRFKEYIEQEDSFYTHQQYHKSEEHQDLDFMPPYNESESLEPEETEETFYSNQHQWRGNHRFQQSNPSSGYNYPKPNPPNDYGKPSTCSFCHSIYHWIENCPHAPPHAKYNRRRGQGYRISRGSRYRPGRFQNKQL